jgi:hypothetical protein
MAGSWRDVGDDESNKDGSAIEHLLVEELPSSIFELPDRGLAQATAAVTRKIEAPLMGFGVVQTQAQSFNVARWAIDHQLYQIGAAIQDLPDDGSPIVLDPSGRARQGTLEAPQVSFPGANLEVKVVLPISIFASFLKVCRRLAQLRLCKPLKGLQGEAQAAEQKASF